MTDQLALNQLHQIAINTDDLATSKAFYEDVLGAKFIASYDPPGLVFFDFQGVRLLLEKGSTPGTIYFRVDDIDDAVQKLQAKGVEFDQLPHVIFRDDQGVFGPKGYEELMAFFKDPAGNILSLASQRPASS
ncbi:MAG: VOC family protein [Pseudomonadales bacterium]|jgi:methylmalonyl-CoA/ethylmalonyl-CoA epimerase|nr:VOC family protein [Pseudomonadales bacterium]MDP7358704.1 VOC family protein [Pseudomonadales bacterium]MDP7597434.1 VOC family protein [Pseudomonadales bacterium]HJN49254.1 VOC family protein [Pseudomonadales bacterium]|tara:strand:- start:307 stop:702 length:396 start_codon:yes stop_codon:yes gene_type:complete